METYGIIEQKKEMKKMKATGIVRKVDELGRIVLPIDLRREFDLKIKDDVEIYTEGDTIVLKKYEPMCVFCGNVDDVNEYKGRMVCGKCMDGFKR